MERARRGDLGRTRACGPCRARVVSGAVDVRWKEAPGGARLKPEKGDILMCQTRARSDCVLKVPSEVGVVNYRPAPRRGVIRNIRRLTKDVARFDIGLSAPMRFEAGQFVVVDSPHLAGARAYSMVNFDTEVDLIELVVKRKPGGGFSGWLFSTQQGDPEVAVFGPLGRAVFRPHEEKNIVCIAGGSGIAAELGWIVAEYGRQPWAIDGVLPTFLGVSTRPAGNVIASLAGFVVFYSALAAVEAFLMVRMIRRGPDGLGYWPIRAPDPLAAGQG